MERCRICFAVDVMLEVLDETQVMDFLESLFAREGINEQLYGCYFVCYKCKALLSKSYNFIQRILKAQRAYLVLQDQKTENTDVWTTFANKLELNSLSYHRVEIDMFMKSDVDLLHEEEIDSKELLGELIKVEYPVDISVLSDDNDDEIDQDETHSIINISSGDSEHELTINRDANEVTENNYENYSHFSIVIEEDEPKPEKRKMTKNKSEDDEYNPEKERKKKKKYNNHSRNKEPKAVKRKFKNDNMYCGQDLTSVKVKNYTELNTEKQDVNFTELNPENILTAKRKTVKEKEYTLESGEEDSKNKKKDKDFTLDDVSFSSESESSYDSYDDNGKKLKRPPREYPRQCDHCNYEIEGAKVHYHHYLLFHSHDMYPYRRSRHRFICQYCGSSRRNPSELAQHEATHGERNVLCTQCDKKFYNAKRLQQHCRTVHCEAKFICDYCKKGFKTKEVFQRHIRIHTGERPFKCEICGAGFAHLGNLKLHLRKGRHANLDDDGNRLPRKGKSRTKKHSKAESTDDHDDIPLKKRKTRTKKRNKQQATDDDDEKPLEKDRSRTKKHSKEQAMDDDDDESLKKGKSRTKKHSKEQAMDDDNDESLKKGKSRTKKHSKAEATDDDDDDKSLKTLSRKKKRFKKAKVHVRYDEDKPTTRPRGRPRKKISRDTEGKSTHRPRGRPRKKSSNNIEVQAEQDENCLDSENANVQENCLKDSENANVQENCLKDSENAHVQENCLKDSENANVQTNNCGALSASATTMKISTQLEWIFE